MPPREGGCDGPELAVVPGTFRSAATALDLHFVCRERQVKTSGASIRAA